MQTVCRKCVLMNSVVRQIRFDWFQGIKNWWFDMKTRILCNSYILDIDTDELWFIYENAYNGFTSCVATSIN